MFRREKSIGKVYSIYVLASCIGWTGLARLTDWLGWAGWPGLAGLVLDGLAAGCMGGWAGPQARWVYSLNAAAFTC